jgi:hypothetical protein
MRFAAASKRAVLTGGVLLLSTAAFGAERQIRSFVGATFAGATTVVDPEDAVTKPSLTLGGSAVFLGELFGAEVEVADSPGFFEAGNRALVTYSRATTVTGSVVVAAPRRLTEYALRPYLVAGAGFMRMRRTTTFDVYNIASVVPAFDIGVGAVGFITDRVGVSWDLRRLQDLGRNHITEGGLSFDQELHLSFWRATMSVVFRY